MILMGDINVCGKVDQSTSQHSLMDALELQVCEQFEVEVLKGDMTKWTKGMIPR